MSELQPGASDLEEPLVRVGGAPKTYEDELNYQMRRMLLPGSLLCMFAWPGFIALDRAMYPDLWLLPVLRVGLTVLGLAAAVLAWRRIGPPVQVARVLLAYLFLATGVITGLTGADEVYLGGFLFVLLVGPAIPIGRAFLHVTTFASLALFAATGHVVGLDFEGARGRYKLLDLATAAVVASILTWVFDRSRRRSWQKSLMIEEQRQRLAEDHAKIDALLLNILPAPIAAELKAKDAVAPRSYDSVTVAFADFAGFTKIAEQVTPTGLVEELDRCFSAFDAVMDTHRVEKLKTIGDGYMFAGGIPQETRTHAVDVVLACLDILRFMEARRREREAAGQPFWSLRLGVNTGPLTAGVVGQKKFAYDVWGDTVNLASRMESSGEPGKVNVSQATWELVRDFFTGESRGKVAAKNKGMVEMFFVHGLRPELSENGQGVVPNAAFRAKYEALRGAAPEAPVAAAVA